MGTQDSGLRAMRSRLDEIKDKVGALAKFNKLTPEQLKEYETLDREWDVLFEDYQRADEVERIRKAAAAPGGMLPGDGSNMDRDPARDRGDVYRPRHGNPWDGLLTTDPMRGLSAEEARSRAYDAVAFASGTTDAARKSLTSILEEFDTPQSDLARYVLYTSHPDYVSSFFATLRGEGATLTDDEVHAVRRVNELARAMSLTTASGGALVPAPLDPTVLITGAGATDGIASVSRNVVATANVWTGVTSAAAVASWDSEGEEASDDATAWVAPTVAINTSRVFLPFSVEVEQDASNFTAEVTKIMVDSQMTLESNAWATGTGANNQPTGIVTALTGGGQVVASAGADTIAIADLYSVYDNQSARHRSDSVWAMNELFVSQVRQLDNTTNTLWWAENLSDDTPNRLLGRPVVFNSAIDGVVTGGSDNLMAVLGNFGDAFVIARRLGFTVERVQHLLGTTSNRPTLQRGLIGYARVGSDSVDDTAFSMYNVT